MRDRALGSTIRMQFVSTNPDGGGAPVAPSSAFAASDIRIYKDGSASEKTTTNGITVTSPFDSITGLHLVEIDTSNSTGDSGFWASGSVYHVRLVTAKTVATYSVSGLLIGEFSLELQTADVRKFGGTAGTFTSGKPDVQAAASVSGAVGSVTGAVGSVTGNVGGNVNGNVVGSVASVTGNVGGNVSGNVSGSVGSVTGAVGSVTGSVGSVVGNVGGSVASVAGAVGSVTGNVGGDVSGKVLGGGSGTISGDGVRAASVTGAVGSVTGSVGSVVGAVVLDSATQTQITAIETFATRITTGIVQDGAVWQFTANMLELGPGGGSSTVTVLPATGIVANRSAGVTLNPVVGETISQAITVYQSDGTTAVDLSGKSLKVIFETMSGTDVAVVNTADITISGTDDNVVTFAYPSAVTASERTLRFAIRDAAAPLTMYLQGVCSVVSAPKVDA